MSAPLCALSTPLRRSPVLQRQTFSTASLFAKFKRRSTYKPSLTPLPSSPEPLEEEGHPRYDPKRFYSVSPGDLVADGRYSIIAKLGWGAGSTVWLAEDLQYFTMSPRYVAINFGNASSERRRRDQLGISQRLQGGCSHNKARELVREPIRHFELTTASGTHLCFVYQPLRMIRDSFPDRKMPFSQLKLFAYLLLRALDYLHSQCQVIHCDIKLQNIMLAFEDADIVPNAISSLKESKNLYKDTPDRRIFQSQDPFGPPKSRAVVPVLADFDVAEKTGFEAHIIQPVFHRAPEAMLGWGWRDKADIWNLGLVIWALGGGSDLFTASAREDGTYDTAEHLAQVIAILGPPDSEPIKREAKGFHCWCVEKKDGTRFWHDANAILGGPFFNAHTGDVLQHDLIRPLDSLEERVTGHNGDGKEEAKTFVDFMRRMLDWDPETRGSAQELVGHEWLAEIRDLLEKGE